MRYRIEIRDRDGKLLTRLKEKSHSYVRAWNFLVNAQVRAAPAGASLPDITNTDCTPTQSMQNLNSAGLANDDTKGTAVGTGTTAVAITDYKLATQIAHGTGSGQLQYQLQAFGNPSVSGPTSSFTTTRVFVNASGATITVKEIGVYGMGYCGAILGNRNFCLIRDVLAAAVAVPNGGAITVTYTIKVTV